MCDTAENVVPRSIPIVLRLVIGANCRFYGRNRPCLRCSFHAGEAAFLDGAIEWRNAQRQSKEVRLPQPPKVFGAAPACLRWQGFERSVFRSLLTKFFHD